MIVALPLLLALSAHAAKKSASDVEPTPAWATEAGKSRAQLDMAKLLIDAGNTESALS